MLLKQDRRKVRLFYPSTLATLEFNGFYLKSQAGLAFILNHSYRLGGAIGPLNWRNSTSNFVSEAFKILSRLMQHNASFFPKPLRVCSENAPSPRQAKCSVSSMDLMWRKVHFDFQCRHGRE